MHQEETLAHSKNPWELFDQRVRSASMARQILPYRPVHADELTDLLSGLFRQEAVTNERVIYVHVPFCRHVCPFCIYTKQLVDDEETVAAWYRTMIAQIQSISDTRWSRSLPFQAVYFGGGTPTAVPTTYLTSIIREIKKRYPLAGDCEITIESTIAEITPELCRELKDAGVNRISLGVQTFHDGIRKSLGRVSDRQKIEKAVQVIHESGITNVCIDLIYMIDDQTTEIWKSDLGQLAKLPLTGCSIYPLITRPPFSRSNLREVGKPAQDTGSVCLPNSGEDLQQEYIRFLEADRFLTREMDHWKRFTPVQYGHTLNGTAKYVSSHGQNADLLAFGPGAGGRVGLTMYMQGGNTEEFIRSGGHFTQSPKVVMQIDERYLLLRNIFKLSEGLQITKAQYSPLMAAFEPVVQELMSTGLVRECDDGYCLTTVGRFWAGNISARFSRRIKELLC